MNHKFQALGILAILIVLTIFATGCPSTNGRTGNSSAGSPKTGESSQPSAGAIDILNASYDPTRELYKEYNEVFAKYWKDKTGQTVTVNQSHQGSGSQARAVIEGNAADVVTLALAYDISAIEKAGLIRPGWQQKFANNSAPYTSTIVFLVRKGNPKNIHDWSDLIKPGVGIITPNPKTSGGARWNFLAAWGYAMRQPGGNEETAKEFVGKLFKNALKLDSGARGSTTTFAQQGLGDVLLAWENEAFYAIQEIGADKLEMVTPSMSILAEPPVAVVDNVVDKHGTRAVAEAYLQYLYTEEAQEIIAKHYYRPRSEAIAAKYASTFPKLTMFTIDDAMFGGWNAAQAKFFADKGVFDQIYQPAAAK